MFAEVSYAGKRAQLLVSIAGSLRTLLGKTAEIRPSQPVVPATPTLHEKCIDESICVQQGKE